MYIVNQHGYYLEVKGFVDINQLECCQVFHSLSAVCDHAGLDPLDMQPIEIYQNNEGEYVLGDMDWEQPIDDVPEFINHFVY